ncbi:uncharacterized protein [Triticum aestivum]|uniref:uncharacterized protein n=1 Tax=Triticum aestivum TaxID=4565 RepID=UPI001D0355AE|nr:uncharacterized protein LOC123160106 [Triticum aestivum]
MLNYFRIGQRCNVYIHDRRFFSTELIKDPWTQEVTTWTYRQAMSGEVSYQNFLLLILDVSEHAPKHVQFIRPRTATAMTQRVTRHARRVYFGGLTPIANEQTVALLFNQVTAAIGGNAFGLGGIII